jgi:hypothetical protein
MRKITVLGFAALFALASACDSKTEEKKGDAKADAKKGEAKKDAKTDAKAEDAKGDEGGGGGGSDKVSIDKLGLKGDAPAGSTVGDAVVGEGAMVQGPGIVVTVEAASDSRPKTVEDAKKEADMYSPKNLKDEKLADGWALTFDNEGGAGKNFFVNVRRDIGGKAIWCETTASQPEQQANALAFCKSLAK